MTNEKLNDYLETHTAVKGKLNVDLKKRIAAKEQLDDYLTQTRLHIQNTTTFNKVEPGDTKLAQSVCHTIFELCNLGRTLRVVLLNSEITRTQYDHLVRTAPNYGGALIDLWVAFVFTEEDAAEAFVRDHIQSQATIGTLDELLPDLMNRYI